MYDFWIQATQFIGSAYSRPDVRDFHITNSVLASHLYVGASPQLAACRSRHSFQIRCVMQDIMENGHRFLDAFEMQLYPCFKFRHFFLARHHREKN